MHTVCHVMLYLHMSYEFLMCKHINLVIMTRNLGKRYNATWLLLIQQRPKQTDCI